MIDSRSDLQSDAVSHTGTRVVNRFVWQMRTACFSLHLRVAEQLADHRKAYAEG